ncbi:MAG: histidine phosphatase family protein [Ignavibacteria bacterium]|nr:histidine phosphatase family protein [Ignavibacteria bacterium]
MAIDIILLRHATAASKARSQSDKERELTDHGKIEASKMFDAVRCFTKQPMTVVCSPYLRAIQTASYFDKNPNIDARLGAERSSRDLLSVIREFGTEQETLLIIGHSPVLGEAAAAMVGASETGIAYGPATAVFIQIGSTTLLHGVITGVLAP